MSTSKTADAEHAYDGLQVESQGLIGEAHDEQQTPSLSRRGIVVSTSIALLVLGAVAAVHTTGSLQSSFRKVPSSNAIVTGEIIDMQQAGNRVPAESCFTGHVRYKPDLPGHGRTSGNFDSCQRRCRRVVGCAHISMWKDGGCHISGADALKHKDSDEHTLAGPKECGEGAFCFENGVKYDPLDGAGPRTNELSIITCHRKCQENDKCATFTYWPDGGCHFQTAEAKAVDTDAYVVSGPSECPLIPTTTTTTTTCYKAHSEYEPLDMSGQGRTAEGSVEECIERCATVEGCAHVSYWEDKGCHLQDEEATIKHGNTNAMSGTPHCSWACFKSRKEYKPIDMRATARTVHGSINECQVRCQQTAGCAHVSYWKDGGCHLQDKNAKLEKADAKAMCGPPVCEE